jgi:hypothetical protein
MWWLEGLLVVAVWPAGVSCTGAPYMLGLSAHTTADPAYASSVHPTSTLRLRYTSQPPTGQTTGQGGGSLSECGYSAAEGPKGWEG